MLQGKYEYGIVNSSINDVKSRMSHFTPTFAVRKLVSGIVIYPMKWLDIQAVRGKEGEGGTARVAKGELERIRERRRRYGHGEYARPGNCILGHES